MEILNEILNELPTYFSSNEFCKKARKKGFHKQHINNGAIALFLHENALQGETRRMWKKKPRITELNNEQNQSVRISDAIELLKKCGYKIMKPVNQWKEV